MLPTPNFQNKYAPLDSSLDSELLSINTIDNGLAIYPGYRLRQAIFTTKSNTNRYYQRQQMQTLLSNREASIRGRVQGDTITGLIKIYLFQASYVQMERPIVSDTVTQQILACLEQIDFY